MTEQPTRKRKVYCGAVIDVFSRKIVGWAIDMRQTTSLVLNALDMAIEARRPVDTVVHSDHGTQFTAWALTNRLKEDRKSTRLNSSHVAISYAVFCLKKKSNT